MGNNRGIKIIGTGSARGSRVVENNDIAEAAGTTDEWIRERTGIIRRNYCSPEESCTQLAIRAAAEALANSGIGADQIGLCVNATMTPQFATPSTACLIQSGLGLREDIASFDLNAACSGFLYALDVARAQMYMNDIEYALVTGSEKFSDILDMNDYGTAIIFGDGAGAVVLKRADSAYFSLQGSRGSDVIWAHGPGVQPAILHMQGRQVFKFATGIIEKSIKQVLEKAGLCLEDVDHFLLHQANERIIDFVVRRMKLNPEKVHKNISITGNTSAASVPLLIDDLAKANKFKEGEKILTVGFGGGLTWAAALFNW